MLRICGEALKRRAWETTGQLALTSGCSPTAFIVAKAPSFRLVGVASMDLKSSGPRSTSSVEEEAPNFQRSMTVVPPAMNDAPLRAPALLAEATSGGAVRAKLFMWSR